MKDLRVVRVVQVLQAAQVLRKTIVSFLRKCLAVPPNSAQAIGQVKVGRAVKPLMAKINT
jgi:hypothetical protein